MIGEDLLVIATTALYAEAQVQTAAHPEVWELVEECFRETKQRVERDIKGLIRNQDTVIAAVGGKALSGRYPLLISGIIRRNLQDYPRHESVLKADDANMHTVV